MSAGTKSRSDLDAAKDRLRVPELWRILKLPGDPPARDGVKFSSPLRPDANPSCSFYSDGQRMRDWSTGKNYDAIDFLGVAVGLKNGEAIRRFIEIAQGRPIVIDFPTALAQPRPKAERPILSGFRKPSHSELQRIVDSRKINPRAVELAQDLGTLRVGEVCGYESWVLLDESRLCAEGRRLNLKPYPTIINEKIKLGERKAHTLRGSNKNWPVGLLPSKEFRQSTDAEPVIVIDTREQQPLPFSRLKTQSGALVTGDYSIAGLESLFAVERKSISDLVGCCMGQNRERFERELHLLRGFRFKRLLIVGSEAEVQEGKYCSKIKPQAVMATLAAFEIRYDLPVVFEPTPELAAASRALGLLAQPRDG